MKEERLEAVNALLDMECIPVGMEQFPASPLSQWEYIKRLIDMSGYFANARDRGNAKHFRGALIGLSEISPEPFLHGKATLEC